MGKYHIDPVKKEERRQRRKKRCIEDYNQMVDKLGHHSTTMEMRKTRKGGALCERIVKLWGGLVNFRKELGIEVPKRAWGSKERTKDRILQVIKKESSISSRTISEKLGLSKNYTLVCLRELSQEGLVKRIRRGRNIRYTP